MNVIHTKITLILLLTLAATNLWAGPPFQTDDPEPVEFRHYEVYLFGGSDGTPVETDPVARRLKPIGARLPIFSCTSSCPWGPSFPPTIHCIFPPEWARTAYGLTDMELGAKYRFIKETKHRPEFGTFTMLEVPTGNYAKGLGVGKVWYKLPIWVQKSWGHWTTYGGAGYQIVPQTGYRNFTYGGWLVQRDIGKKLTLGAEVFSHGPEGLRHPRPCPPRWLILAAITTFEIPAGKFCLPTGTLPSGKLKTTHTSGCTGPGDRKKGKASTDSWRTIFSPR